jgi:hypothetical protein
MTQTHLHMRKMAGNIFDETWGQTVTDTTNKWDECTKVLSRKEIELVVAKPSHRAGPAADSRAC